MLFENQLPLLLNSLLRFIFQNNPDVAILLSSPIYQTDDHVKMEWFHNNLSKANSEQLLSLINRPGSFLVRNSENNTNQLTIMYW